MFEKYEVDAYFTSKDAVLACYACGKTTGLVVDIGGSGTTITPLQDGWIDLKGLTRLPIGGRYMDGHARKVLFKYHNLSKLLPSYRIQKVFATDRMPSIVEKLNCGNVHRSFDAYMNLEVGREYKENMCRVSEYSLETELDRYKNLPLVPYELPDGTVIDVGVEKYEVPEILFDPTLVDLEDTDVLATLPMRQKALSETDMDVSSGTQSYANIARFHEQETIKEPLHQAICNALYRCDIETHSTLVTNIVLTGGGSAFEGLSDRLKGEIEAIVHRRSPTWRVRILSLGNNEKAICAWLGGSILASLGSFHELWISKQEYLEYGAALVDKKCP